MCVPNKFKFSSSFPTDRAIGSSVNSHYLNTIYRFTFLYGDFYISCSSSAIELRARSIESIKARYCVAKWKKSSACNIMNTATPLWCLHEIYFYDAKQLEWSSTAVDKNLFPSPHPPHRRRFFYIEMASWSIPWSFSGWHKNELCRNNSSFVTDPFHELWCFEHELEGISEEFRKLFSLNRDVLIANSRNEWRIILSNIPTMTVYSDQSSSRLQNLLNRSGEARMHERSELWCWLMCKKKWQHDESVPCSHAFGGFFPPSRRLFTWVSIIK